MEQRAQDILFNLYWSASGWRPQEQRVVSPEEFRFAKQAGLMFEPLLLNHTQLVDKAIKARDLVNQRRVADAFVASLSTRRLDQRSALGSCAVLRHFPRHDHTPELHSKRCAICGGYNTSTPREEDLNVLNFERLKWGGVRHLQPLYAAFDLEQFAKQKPESPTMEAVAIFQNLMKQIETAPTNMTAAKLESHFAKVLKSNKSERDVLISIFGLCGVLEKSTYPGFLLSFIPVNARPIPGKRFVDTSYPACWWTGADGLNRNAVNAWFGHLL